MPEPAQTDIDWSQTVAGPWLAQTLAALPSPNGLPRDSPRFSGNVNLRAFEARRATARLLL
jgi:non-specific serine/threonine protein kinase